MAIPSGTTAVFRGRNISSAASFSIVNNIPTVSVDLTLAMTEKAGKIPFEIILTSTANTASGKEYKLITATLYFDIRKSEKSRRPQKC